MPRLNCCLFTALALAAVSVTPSLTQAPSLDDVLTRARDAVARFEAQADLLVADEQCEAKAFESTVERSGGAYAFAGNAGRIDPRGKRKWNAEVATVATPDLAARGKPWAEFRAMTSVDGRAAGAERPTLSRLFVADGGWSLDDARAVTSESGRAAVAGFPDYIVYLPRVVNTPALPLLVLHPANAARFSFRKTGEDSIERTKVWKVEYRELRAPTLYSTPISGSQEAGCPASGTIWIDPASGEVVRAMLQCLPAQAPECVDQVTVTYRRDPKLGVRVPAEMLERPEGPSGRGSFNGVGSAWVEQKCTYSNVRRIEGATKMRPPK